jgi:hypothetical protein
VAWQGGGRRNRERQEDEYIDVDADDGPADRSEFAFKAAPENEQPGAVIVYIDMCAQ